MKIALITIHNANNYGAVLQAYATKKILSNNGDVSTINYNNRHLAHHLDLIRFEPSIHGLKMLVHDLLRLPYRLKAINRFKKFINDNMNLTQKLSANDLNNGKANNFDLYVCGSDQIWNPDIVSPNHQIDPIFFLSFVPQGSKKISYASSIGHHHYNEDEKKEVAKLLEDFTLITTRESDGVKKLQEILPNREIHHVLDPTLLLTQDEWLNDLNIKLTEAKEKYILVYSVPRTKLMKQAIEYFSKKLKMKVVTIDQMFFPLTKVDEHIRNAGPKEFIELYANASFVITDSFHGTCFAVNFGKPFVSISAGKRANRISSFLSLLNMNERLIKNEEELENIHVDIDVKEVFNQLDHVRAQSINYLDHNINGKK